jgi:hypothetical protein
MSRNRFLNGRTDWNLRTMISWSTILEMYATKDMKNLLRQTNRIIDLNIIYKELYANGNTE